MNAMFDPSGKAKIVIEQKDGGTLEVPGIVKSIDVSTQPVDVSMPGMPSVLRGLTETEVSFLATGEPVVSHDPSEEPREATPLGSSFRSWVGGPPPDDENVLILPQDRSEPRELMQSGEGDTEVRASRLFLVELQDEFSDDPIRVLMESVPLGSPHPRAPELLARSYLVEERLSCRAVRVRVTYEYIHPSLRVDTPESIDDRIGEVLVSMEGDTARPYVWDYESRLSVAMAVVAAVVYPILRWIL